ncbi:MAG: dual specificity protein phosphatase family protein [Myxococcaceae bacterium]|nr:dual specificity protein phosphatase family protein [Myxococcaceae bacterium]MBH2006273.1 dual specificity protein phosphatase family protein [Myxococcaceae bacterium]
MMTDLFPTRPRDSLDILPEFSISEEKSDQTIPAPDAPDLERAPRAYFQRALFGRKLLVGLAESLRKPWDWLKRLRGQESEIGEPGKRFSWFNRIQIPHSSESKKLYLGAIPDRIAQRKIPSNALFVSILQPFEAEHMDPLTRSFRRVVRSKDNVGMKPSEIQQGVLALDAAMKSNPNFPVYLHCKSGVGRSATVLAAYLVKHQNLSLEEAISLVQRDRPDAQLRGWFGVDTKHTVALREWSRIQDQLADLKRFLLFSKQDEAVLSDEMQRDSRVCDLIHDFNRGVLSETELSRVLLLAQSVPAISQAMMARISTPPILIDSIQVGQMEEAQLDPRSKAYATKSFEIFDAGYQVATGWQSEPELKRWFEFSGAQKKSVRREISCSVLSHATESRRIAILRTLHLMLSVSNAERPALSLKEQNGCGEFVENYRKAIREAQREFIGWSKD